jgi:hypothetical protein
LSPIYSKLYQGTDEHVIRLEASLAETDSGVSQHRICGFQAEEGWLWRVGEVLDNPLGERETGLQGTTGEECWLGPGRSHTGDSHNSILLDATSPDAQEQYDVALLSIVVYLRLPGADACSFDRRGKILFCPQAMHFDKRNSQSQSDDAMHCKHMPALRGRVTPNHLILSNNLGRSSDFLFQPI